MTEQQLNMRRLGMEASYLAGCALHGMIPECAPQNLDELYKFCKFHSVTSMVAMALEEIWKSAPADESQMQCWRQARDKAIRKNILLNAERQRILEYLESIGCWYMPLKGSLLQFDYPKFGMRQMSDNDILFDEAFQEQIHDHMIGQGYEAEVYQKGNHDAYMRKPVYHFEMHKSLFMNSMASEFSSYYRDIKKKIKKDADNDFGFHFSVDDFYIYMVIHAYKHYLYSGIGIRNLLDVYVYLNRHREEMDWEYVNSEMQKIGAFHFEQECRNLSEKLFAVPQADPGLSDSEMGILEIYFSSGTYGTSQAAVENALRSQENRSGKVSKIRYLLRRLFPSVQYMIDMEPRLEKKRWLIPLAYIRRLFRGVFLRPVDIIRELMVVRRAKHEK